MLPTVDLAEFLDDYMQLEDAYKDTNKEIASYYVEQYGDPEKDFDKQVEDVAHQVSYYR